MEIYDTVIVGAGPAGCAAALALLDKQAAKVALIHKPAAKQKYRIGESAMPSVNTLLRRLGLHTPLTQLGHTPCYGTIARWGSELTTEQDLNSKGEGYGHHLNRAAFDQWLRQAAVERGVHLYDQHQFKRIGRLEEQYWGVEVHSEHSITRLASRTLIDAGGRQSPLARQLGATRHRLDSLTAVCYITASPQTNQNLHHLSLIESHPMGWWYCAGLPDGRSVICFMSDTDIIKAQHLNQTSGMQRIYAESVNLTDTIPPPHRDDTLLFYPANTVFIDKVCGNGWIAIGDAAIGLDPLTSSGINCALADGIAAAEALSAYLNGDNGKLRRHAQHMNTALNNYLAERKMQYQREQRWLNNSFWQRRV